MLIKLAQKSKNKKIADKLLVRLFIKTLSLKNAYKVGTKKQE